MYKNLKEIASRLDAIDKKLKGNKKRKRIIKKVKVNRAIEKPMPEHRHIITDSEFYLKPKKRKRK
jgi:hypothetical protein